MAIKMNLGLKQTQQLAMTPQLQQAIKLLTLTHLEMTTVIAEELVENPCLEEIDEVPEELPDHLEQETNEATSQDFDGPEIIEKGQEEFDWDAYTDFNSGAASTGPSMVSTDPDSEFNYENIVTKSEGLTEHLLWQLMMEELSSDEVQFGKSVIHNLNEDGYLEEEINPLAEQSHLDESRALEILRLIQHFDPIGCAARNLSECLLIQLDLLDKGEDGLLKRIISEGLEDLQKKNYGMLQKTFGITKEVAKNYERLISELNPRPGRLIDSEAPHYVVPDIFVKRVGDEIIVTLNDEGVPRLRLSENYLKLIRNREQDQTSEFLQERLKSAQWLMKSIDNRQRTIMKVSEAIVRYQPEFFRKGPSYLRPMILKDIANEIGMHESTVSRVTTNKYMHTPLGVFELKFFFNASVGSDRGGVEVAHEAIKHKIKTLIEREVPKRPLSDQKIADLLAKENIIVARRTVAKYREMLGIPASSERKV